MEKRVCIGKIVAAHGIKGEVKVRSVNQNPLDLDKYGAVENAVKDRKDVGCRAADIDAQNIDMPELGYFLHYQAHRRRSRHNLLVGHLH